MKKLWILVLILFIVSSINAQDVVATQEQVNKFFKTKTYVVYDDNIFNTYNDQIKKSVELNWNITPVAFITTAEFEKLKSDVNSSFLIRTKITFDDDKNFVAYTFLSLLLGGNFGSVNNMPTLCSFPLSYYNVDYDRYIYKLGSITKFMQNHMILCRENPNLTSKNIIQYYNNNVENIGSKTLYVLTDELDSDVNTESKIAAVYKGKVVLTETEEIEKLIADKDPDALFLHKVGAPEDSDQKSRCFKLIMGAADGKLYYTDHHKINEKNGDGFLKSDFKKLSRK